MSILTEDGILQPLMRVMRPFSATLSVTVMLWRSLDYLPALNHCRQYRSASPLAVKHVGAEYQSGVMVVRDLSPLMGMELPHKKLLEGMKR
ncbi:hypothetical protein MN186_11510 [Aliiroseovarius sp. N1F302]|uniref:hypothetical protein n=1 Tax=Aliiroseovarius sediminis TaxID=2925839 RepID=UPI001F5A913F|nr:hypothetical protein [Aliiroseovarius sediminis]MCI2395075.1 hypothetical protein [Aliiroseovarius sediminis]